MKLDDKNLLKALDKVGEQSIIFLSKLLKENDKKASGNLINTLDYDVVKTLNGLTLEILAEPYFTFGGKGRMPFGGKNIHPDYTKAPQGKYVPIKPLQKWALQKGLEDPKGAAFAISRSIAYKGIKPLYAKDKLEKSLIKNISAIIKAGVEKDIQEMINKIYYK